MKHCLQRYNRHLKEQGHLGKDDQKKTPQSSLPGDQRFRNLRLLDLNDAESESLQDPSSSPLPTPKVFDGERKVLE